MSLIIDKLKDDDKNLSPEFLKDNENLLKEFLKEFYRQIIRIENYKEFENILIEWMKDFFIKKNKTFKMILKLMKNHEEKENWFSSIIGFFYEYNIDDDDDNKNQYQSLDFYLLSINNEKKLISLYQVLNIIIGKFLLSLHYYKNIILNKRNSFIKEFGNLKNGHVTSQIQFENFDG
ncbi:unnamed protein product [Rhizophagus irregularis]|nr:unnamed protein product [Rhizophagus irregularis]CAB5384345.1 unnamed protein product [Rhizophagus irregularis]